MSSQLLKSFHSLKNRFLDAYSVEPTKYQRKGIFFCDPLGIGKYVGYFLLLSYFTLLPKIFEAVLPFLIQNLPNKLIMGFGIVFLNFLILLCYNVAMIFIYKAKHPFFEKYRVNHKNWPWQENYEQWIKTLKKTLKTVAFNSFIVGGILSLSDSWMSDYKSSIQEIPDTKTIAWQFIFFLVLEDLFFYLGHSTLHKPQFYWIHKQHHEYGNTVSIAAQYAHPIEHIFGNSFPTFIGYKILSHIYPVHCIAIWVFLTFRIIETCDGHSGYEWSWAQSQLLPFSAGSAYHNFHHSHNVGNYGSFFKLWDSLFGTNAEYVKFKFRQEKQAKQSFPNPESKKVEQKKVD